MSVGRLLRPPHGTTPAEVITNKNKLSSLKKNPIERCAAADDDDVSQSAIYYFV